MTERYGKVWEPVLRSLLCAFVGFGMCSACSRATDTTVTLDCSAQEIRDILRIHSDHSVQDLSFTPPKSGTAEVTDSSYVLRFDAGVRGFELLFRINRFTSDGTRTLQDDNGKFVSGHGGFDQITCKPYSEKPL